MIRRSAATLICVAFAFISSNAIGQSSPAQNRAPAFEFSSMQQVLYSPVTALPEFTDSEVAIINHSFIQENATISLYSSDGKQNIQKVISLQPGETQRFPVAKIAEGLDLRDSLGGMTVEYYAPPMVIAAQITLKGYRTGGNLDYLLEDAMEYHSSSFDAVWWEQEEGHSFVVIGNASDQVAAVYLEEGSNKMRVTLHHIRRW